VQRICIVLENRKPHPASPKEEELESAYLKK